MTTLRLGTRRSTLALAQATQVADHLKALGREVDLVPITTLGDRSPHAVTMIGGTGIFAAAIRRALLDGEIDLAVHSLKDLPTTPEPGLVVAATPPREDPLDVLVARDGLTLAELPPGSVVGTGSPRRAAQLRALGRELDVVAIRGNVDTRLEMVRSRVVDAVVLARAGLARIDRLDEATETLDPARMLPAPGQGALAVECREDRTDVREAVAPLDDDDTRVCVAAERALLAALEAGCTAPVGALAEVRETPALVLHAFVGAVDGSAELRRSVDGARDDPAGTGRRLAALLFEAGAAALTATTLPDPHDKPPDGIPGAVPTLTTEHQHPTEHVS
jgi:hydroxymethylbilane synthase